MAMHVLNLTNQDYWFGPLHLPASGAIDVDDTDDTSLYLNDDSVADAINTLYASNKIQVSGQAQPFPRPTGKPEVLHGDGSPEGIVFAGQGSIFLRRDSGSIYTKKTGIHVNTGWASIAQGSITTVGPWSGGPPSTPNDGDIWIASNVDGNGRRWQFQYNASSGDTHKWEFIGGAPVHVEDATDRTIALSGATWTNDANAPSWTPARGGDFDIDFGAEIGFDSLAWGAEYLGVGINGSSPSGPEGPDVVNTSYAAGISGQLRVSSSKRHPFTGCAANTAIKIYVYASGSTPGSPSFGYRFMTITPIRIS